MYKGIYIYKDVRIPNGVPRIISEELFEEVQEITRKHKHGHRPAIENYLLSGKLFCGHAKILWMESLVPQVQERLIDTICA